MFIPVVSNKDLVAIGPAAHGDGAVDEAGFLLSANAEAGSKANSVRDSAAYVGGIGVRKE